MFFIYDDNDDDDWNSLDAIHRDARHTSALIYYWRWSACNGSTAIVFQHGAISDAASVFQPVCDPGGLFAVLHASTQNSSFSLLHCKVLSGRRWLLFQVSDDFCEDWSCLICIVAVVKPITLTLINLHLIRGLLEPLAVIFIWVGKKNTPKCHT